MPVNEPFPPSSHSPVSTRRCILVRRPHTNRLPRLALSFPRRARPLHRHAPLPTSVNSSLSTPSTWIITALYSLPGAFRPSPPPRSSPPLPTVSATVTFPLLGSLSGTHRPPIRAPPLYSTANNPKARLPNRPTYQKTDS
jgi:hypothetical protein